ncbi:DUF3592 domain-containing protein [Aureibacter tunicatorum]|uniref:DUF3592 domain-containing protein n=1 Tax=Aureibacter tunicatorum TaxID=866807 RepID=A0AAE3XTK6_9BACT|nr:DUF3592 domain-containing protein [Aureibacter tunicatorum]MDR6241621.1 hypothetical protein [Aureibacter tunicatorum]BDD07157.1 hypothetical protein AUTU_46400 [Aureibacter tunicatorum]
MEKIKKILHSKIGPIIGGVFVFLIVILFGFLQTYFFQKNIKFTVGEVTRIWEGNKGRDYFSYKYIYKGRYYNQRMTAKCSEGIILGQRYVVAFDSENPKKSVLICDENTTSTLGQTMTSTFKPTFWSASWSRNCCNQR